MSTHTSEPKPAAKSPWIIQSGGLSARILDIGASLYDVRLDGVPYPLVLGLANLDESEGRTLTAIGGIHRAHDQLSAKVDRINERLGLADTEA